jgi:hypothetical protein
MHDMAGGDKSPRSTKPISTAGDSADIETPHAPSPHLPAIASSNAPTPTEETPPTPPYARTPSTSLGCLIGAGIVGAALLIAGLLVAFAIRDSANRVAETAEKMNPANVIATVLPPATPTIVVRPPAVLQVRAINDLASAQSLMSTVAEVEKARIGNIVYEKLVLIACGRVKAGIDLTELKEEDVQVSNDGKTVRVKLPKAELLDTYLIDDSNQPCTTKVYDRTNLILLPETQELEAQAREKALEAIRDTAIQSGILSDARRNAEVAIERILLNAGYEKVEFVEE